MSRFHPVRPKKNKHKHQQQQPAAPARGTVSDFAAGEPATSNARTGENGDRPRPTEAQMEAFARDRAKAVFDEVYKLRNGLELDASIARWKKMLTLYDRELELVAAQDGSKQHRWTVSPSIAFRVDKRLHELLAEQEQLKAECGHEARQILEQFMRDHKPEGNSLCPPKRVEPAFATGSAGMPVSQADEEAMLASPADAPGTSATKGGQAQAEPIAA